MSIDRTEDRDKYFMDRDPALPFTGRKDLEELCRHAIHNGSHEIHITAGETPFILISKDLFAVGKRDLGISEVKDLVQYAFSERRLQSLLSGEPQDLSFTVPTGRRTSLRFRVNISAGLRCGESISMVLRSIPTEIPSTEEVALPTDLVEYCTSLASGVVIFAGATGTGKSTSMASLIKHRMLNSSIGERFYSAEAPVEFLHNYDTPSGCTMIQAEVGTHIESFATAVRNILRRNTTLFLLGETRDAETVEALMRAGSVGPLAYTTCHANDVVRTIPRLIGVFPMAERESALYNISQGTRLYVAQTLLKRKGGGMVACREYLMPDRQMADQIGLCTPDNVAQLMRELLLERGTTMGCSAQMLLEAGHIDESEREMVRREYG